MKTAEELNAMKEEVETLNKKLAELTKEELEQLSGGMKTYTIFYCDNPQCPLSRGIRVDCKQKTCELCGSPGHLG